MKINIIPCVSFVSFRRLFISLPPTLPRGLAASVDLSCCQGCQKPGPKLRAPAMESRWPVFWWQPAAVGSPGEETSYSPSSIIGAGRRGRGWVCVCVCRGGQSNAWHSVSGLFQMPSHGTFVALTHTHMYSHEIGPFSWPFTTTRTHSQTHSGQWIYSGSWYYCSYYSFQQRVGCETYFLVDLPSCERERQRENVSVSLCVLQSLQFTVSGHLIWPVVSMQSCHYSPPGPAELSTKRRRRWRVRQKANIVTNLPDSWGSLITVRLERGEGRTR